MNSPLRVGCVVLFASLAALSAGQGGLGGGGTQTDSRPWNPANWRLTTESVGLDTVSSWVLVNGVPTNQITEISWSSNQYYPFPGAVNMTGTPRDVFMNSEGESILRVQWIGDGPPPTRVILRVTSFAWGGTKPLGTISVNNGLNTVTEPDEPDPDWFDFVLKQFGSVLKKIALDSNGYAEVRIPKLARASATGVTAHSYGDARSTEQEIANRALEIVGDPDPTFTIGFHDAPVPNKQVDPTILKMDIGLICFGYGVELPPPGSTVALGLANAVFRGLPWGSWNEPQGAWDWTDVAMGHWTVGQIYREYSADQVVEMIRNGPITLSNNFHIIDQDQISETGSVEVRIHAPWEFPVWTSDEEKCDEFRSVSGWVIRNPYGPISISESSGYQKSVTWAVSIGGSGAALPQAHPLLRALSISGQYGQTATVTLAQSYTMTVDAGPSDMQFCVEKQNFWREKGGFFLGYANTGYIGLQDMLMTRWASGTKEDAERVDHRYRLGSKRYP